MIEAAKKKGRMRHPLRNEWQEHEAAFVREANASNAQGAIARLMLAIVPAFLDFLEAERDGATPPMYLFDAVAAAAGMMIENAIENRNVMVAPHAALQHMLSRIYNVVSPRVAGKSKTPRIILPGRG
jgi:hypothetical protein